MVVDMGFANVTIREVFSPQEILDLQRLRFQVWRGEGTAIYNQEGSLIADAHDEHAFHWCAFADGQMLAAARLCLHHEVADVPDAEMFTSVTVPTPVASINRLVVLQGYRNRGIGTILDEARIQRAGDLGAASVVATPINIESRKRSLRKRGFQFISGVIGHPIYSPTLHICPCYFVISGSEPVSHE